MKIFDATYEDAALENDKLRFEAWKYATISRAYLTASEGESDATVELSRKAVKRLRRDLKEWLDATR